jgi:hypothetical protein
MLEALVRGRRLDKAYVNDGGDIAIHLTPGQSLRAGIVADSTSSPFRWGSAPSYGAMGSCAAPPQGLTPPSAGGLVTSREPPPPHLIGEESPMPGRAYLPAASSACDRSARMSSMCSRPIDSRT